MVIKVYKNWLGAWEPCREAWDLHRHILGPMCVCGAIAFRKKEHIVEFFATRGVTAIETSDETEEVSEQLMLF